MTKLTYKHAYGCYTLLILLALRPPSILFSHLKKHFWSYNYDGFILVIEDTPEILYYDDYVFAIHVKIM